MDIEIDQLEYEKFLECKRQYLRKKEELVSKITAMIHQLIESKEFSKYYRSKTSKKNRDMEIVVLESDTRYFSNNLYDTTYVEEAMQKFKDKDYPNYGVLRYRNPMYSIGARLVFVISAPRTLAKLAPTVYAGPYGTITRGTSTLKIEISKNTL